MLHLSPFESLFESSSLTPEQESFLNRWVNGRWELDPSTGRVDVDGLVDLSRSMMTRIPVKFGVVSGDFLLYDSSIISLVNSPVKVGGDFNCDSCKLSSLEGAPEEVGGSFSCSFNNILSLEGAPSRVGKNFACVKNQLTSLRGAPKEVGGAFICYSNLLETLEGAPERVGKNFYCWDNQLTSLKGCPTFIGEDLNCKGNPLVTLTGAPEKMRGHFVSTWFSIAKKRWNVEGWIREFIQVGPEGKSLLASLFVPSINQQLVESPEKAIMTLKSVWNLPDFAGLQKEFAIPKKYEGELDTLADLSDLGF